MAKLASIIIICLMPIMLFSNINNEAIPHPKMLMEISTQPNIANGIAETFWNDGSLKGRGSVLNSSKTGNWTYFHQGTNGTKRLFAGSYVNGKRNGRWDEFSENGKLLARADYRNGVLHGEFTIFHEGGKIPHSVQNFRDGIKESRYFEYYPNGNTKEASMYSNGIKTGPITIWYPSGRIQARGTLNNGVKEGRWRYNDETGTAIEQGLYSNGTRVGAWTYFDRSSNSQKTVNY